MRPPGWLWFVRRFGRATEVPLALCVHFSAWRYGRGDFNPYENYCTGLARGETRSELRQRFTTFLQHYRPRDFGTALGVRLSARHPPWQYPWARGTASSAWLARPQDCPDILTHFSEAGIASERIEQEFRWLEDTFRSIRDRGYVPQQFAGAPVARRLEAADGAAAYLMLDGNHRLAALGALGFDRVVVRWSGLQTVREREARRWAGVARGAWSLEDALRVFRAYFHGNHAPCTTDEPAPLQAESAVMPAP